MRTVTEGTDPHDQTNVVVVPDIEGGLR